MTGISPTHSTIPTWKLTWLIEDPETPEDQRRLLSMQLTGAWANELINKY